MHSLPLRVVAIPLLIVAAVRAEEPEVRVRRAASATYVHGMTAEIAIEAIGPEGVPALRRLLTEPDFPRRDNVVAMLGFLGSAQETDALETLSYMEASRVAEEDRARLLAPQALGQIASRGERRALEALLRMTDPASAGVPADIRRMALRGLAVAGAPEGLARLAALARGEMDTRPPEAPLREDARAALELRAELEGTIRTDPFDPGTGAIETDAVLDGHARVHETRLTYANHRDVTNPMTDTRLDRILDVASLRAGRADTATDVACCVSLRRGSGPAVFGTAGDGLDSIDSDSELTTVLNDPAARVKVVRIINHCGGPAVNVIGCAWRPGNGMAVVRVSGESAEAVVWAHEYGHNAGLVHNTTSTRYLMNATNYGTNDSLTQAECDAYHAPPASTQASPIDVGACADSDGDAVHDLEDNCKTIANATQADADGDGIGDACEGPYCGNGVREGSEACDGADLGGATCSSQGYLEGTLRCRSDCAFDASSCGCRDADGDARADAAFAAGSCPVDCDDANGLVWSRPGEAAALAFASRDALQWVHPADPGGSLSALKYDTLRSGDPADFAASATCVESRDGADTTSVDTAVPVEGRAFFYLVRATNVCPSGEGSLGASSSGSPRDGRECP